MRALAVAAALASGCAAMMPTPPAPPPLDGNGPPRLQRVDGALFRSGQPSRADLERLVQRHGVRAVLKLNRGHDDAPAGVRVIEEPLDPLREPPPERIARILDEIDRAPKPLLVHCTHGEDRTGLIVALYRIRRGATVEEAYADMVRHGFHPYRGVWRAWLRAAGWN